MHQGAMVGGLVGAVSGPSARGLVPRAPDAGAKTRTVLLVDDDPSTVSAARILLERTGRFKVVGEASNGLEGVRRARQTRPDIVVLDVDMPGMTGFQAAPLIRQASPKTKVALFSDHVDNVLPAAVQGLGADVLVPKGSDLSALVPALLGLDSPHPRHPGGAVAGNLFGNRNSHKVQP